MTAPTCGQVTFWVGVSARERQSKAYSEEGPAKPPTPPFKCQWQKAESMPMLVPNSEEKCPLAPDSSGSAALQSGGENLRDKESAGKHGNPHSNLKSTDHQIVEINSNASGSSNGQYQLRASSKWMSAASKLRIRLPTLPGHDGHLL